MYIILWGRDRQNQEDERGRLRNNAWVIEHGTQASNGLYNVRAKDNTLLMRKNVTVEGDVSLDRSYIVSRLYSMQCI